MGHSPELIAKLEDMAFTLRRNCITQFEGSRGGHVGGTMSIVDLVTVLYFHHLRIDPRDPDWPGRDRLILSKAHACEALYAALVEIGYIPKEKLPTFYQLGSPLQGHADRWCTPGIEFSGGSLGEGLSHALGVALAAFIEKPVWEPPPPRYPTYRPLPKFRVYCILGDGECQEGQVWEAAMAAATYKLDNLIAIVDYNKYCIDGPVNEVVRVEPLVDKWRAFGWWVTEVDGHSISQLCDVLDLAANLYGDGRPKCIISHTIKGRGVPFWEERHTHSARGPEMEGGLKQAVQIYKRGG
ncbi:MAG: transketolase [Candidatus Bathyarchaeia archaeon]